jgi:hypothetical protein
MQPAGLVADNQASQWLTARLSATELAALGRQGFVSVERPARGRPRAKLRFRVRGRQRVIYIGVDEALVAALAAELRRRQQTRRSVRNARTVAQECRRRRRQWRAELGPQLAESGFHLHGYELRRRRPSHITPQPGEQNHE